MERSPAQATYYGQIGTGVLGLGRVLAKVVSLSGKGGQLPGGLHHAMKCCSTGRSRAAKGPTRVARVNSGTR